MKRTRRNHGAAFKAQVELAIQFSVDPTQITEWKQHLLARAVDVFSGTKSTSDAPDLRVLHAKIGQLALENDFFRRGASQGGITERKAIITRTHALPVKRQCQLLELARSTAYAQPRPVSLSDLALRRWIDELHLASPFAGARMLRDLLRREGHRIGRKRVRTVWPV